jgi:Uncharacterized conserved protein
MWTCPNCGRAFRSANQPHDCGKAPETIDEYIDAQDEALREPLRQIRAAIRAQLPEAKEKISWSMPTYWQGSNVLHFAAAKKHIGLYPGPEAVAHFADRLDEGGYRYSKGTIRIPYSGELPLELIAEIAAWCRDTGNHA